MNAADFETRYRADPDPWQYETSEYERAKYAATLDACGTGPFTSALELGASIGVFTAQLTPRCHALTTVDLAPTAVAMARERLAGVRNVEIVEGALPEAFPDDRFDLIVASEILYYLSPGALTGTIAAIDRTLRPAGRLVAVHWRPPGPDRHHTADDVHARVHGAHGLTHAGSRATPDYLLDAWVRDA